MSSILPTVHAIFSPDNNEPQPGCSHWSAADYRYARIREALAIMRTQSPEAIQAANSIAEAVAEAQSKKSPGLPYPKLRTDLNFKLAELLPPIEAAGARQSAITEFHTHPHPEIPRTVGDTITDNLKLEPGNYYYDANWLKVYVPESISIPEQWKINPNRHQFTIHFDTSPCPLWNSGVSHNPNELVIPEPGTYDKEQFIIDTAKAIELPDNKYICQFGHIHNSPLEFDDQSRHSYIRPTIDKNVRTQPDKIRHSTWYVPLSESGELCVLEVQTTNSETQTDPETIEHVSRLNQLSSRIANWKPIKAIRNIFK